MASGTMPELPWMMLGIIGIFTFLALGWQFSQKRAARRLLERSVDRSEREECSFPAEHASEGDGRPYAAAGRGRRTGRRSRRLPVSAGLRHSFFTQERTAATENLHLKDV